MKKIKEIFETDIIIKKGTLFMYELLAFFCGIIFMFFVALIGLVG